MVNFSLSISTPFITPESPVDGNQKLEFVYDYMGRRVKKTVYTYASGSWDTGTLTLFVYDGWNLIQELDESETVQKAYVWGLDLSQSMQGAGGIGGLIAAVDVADDSMYFYNYDANGNVGQVVDSAGVIVAKYEYDPFGNALVADGDYADENAFRFSTKYFDGVSGLYYYGYRYYEPVDGRWLTRDPIEEDGGVNLYGFVLNDGVNQFDKLGLDFIYFDGSTITEYSGSGYIRKNQIDCGKAGQTWNAASGGTNGKVSLPEGWYKTIGLRALADKAGSLVIGNRSEKSFWENGVYYQGTMAAWDKSGYGNHIGPYGGQAVYGYDPNDPNDKKIGMPKNVEFKVGLKGIHGNSTPYSQGYRIHPMDRTTTSGCIGVKYYSDSVSFLSYIKSNSGIELYVGNSLPCCPKNKTSP